MVYYLHVLLSTIHFWCFNVIEQELTNFQNFGARWKLDEEYRVLHWADGVYDSWEQLRI